MIGMKIVMNAAIGAENADGSESSISRILLDFRLTHYH